MGRKLQDPDLTVFAGITRVTDGIVIAYARNSVYAVARKNGLPVEGLNQVLTAYTAFQ